MYIRYSLLYVATKTYVQTGKGLWSYFKLDVSHFVKSEQRNLVDERYFDDL